MGQPITVSWEADPNFMGAFKANHLMTVLDHGVATELIATGLIIERKESLK